jgi:hypothetical protein
MQQKQAFIHGMDTTMNVATATRIISETINQPAMSVTLNYEHIEIRIFFFFLQQKGKAR